MKAILSVIGKDRVGIIAQVSNYLTSIKVNIEDISQTVMQNYFSMIMLVDMSASTKSIKEINAELDELGKSINMSIRIQHEDIFNAMHKI